MAQFLFLNTPKIWWCHRKEGGKIYLNKRMRPPVQVKIEDGICKTHSVYGGCPLETGKRKLLYEIMIVEF